MNAKNTAETIRSILAMPGQKIARKRLDELAKDLEATARSDAERDERYEKLQAIGKSAAESIADMVAALECDYDRLEELRDAREALTDDIEDIKKNGGEDGPGRGGTAQQLAEAQDALSDWDIDNAEELKELEEAAGDCESRAEAEKRIREDPLSVDLTFGSCSVGERPEVDGFTILLSSGGPATRIVGELDANNEPKRAWIEAQDWFQPWTEYHGDGCEHDSLLTYCRCFNYEPGE
jgi:hypothetical protein